MPKGRSKKNIEVEVSEPVSTNVLSEKERLQKLYQDLKDLKVNSIGDLENLIARS